MGYKPQEDDDGDLSFIYQMKTIFVLMNNEDEPYLTVMLPHFSEIEEGEETLTLATCNSVTRDLKFGKVYIDQTLKNVSAECDFYYTDEESLIQNLERSICVLGIIRPVYRKVKNSLSE